MALVSFKASVNAAGNSDAVPGISNVDVVDTALDAVKTSLGVLQADAATPTEAHVDDADVLADAAIVISQAAQAAPLGGVQVIVDLATVTTRTDLHKCFQAIERAAQGSGWFTP